MAKSAKTPPAPKQQEAAQEKTISHTQLSIAFGHLLAKNFNDMGIAFDLDSIIKGLKDASAGLPSPLSETECVKAINEEQKKAFEALSLKNLKAAEDFLLAEAKKTDIQTLEEGKVLYKILQEGNGHSVQDSGKISIRYKGSLLNGDVFGESSKEETIDIAHLVTGLKKALIGMKEGEKRLIHIHPEQGYGTEGMLPPNSLLSFEVEVAKAKVEEPLESAATDLPETSLEKESEIR